MNLVINIYTIEKSLFIKQPAEKLANPVSALGHSLRIREANIGPKLHRQWMESGMAKSVHPCLTTASGIPNAI